MELKVVCQCDQKFKFDVEPVNGRMPFTVNCPVCNADGTAAANALIAAHRACFRRIEHQSSRVAAGQAFKLNTNA